jgi:hypothetical protein
MKLVVTVGRDGMPLQVQSIPDDAQFLVVSGDAREGVIQLFGKKEAFCQRCHMLHRTQHLVEGECGPRFGCRADVDRDLWNDTSDPQQMIEQFETATKVWASFADHLPRPGDVQTLPAIESLEEW